MCAAAKVMLREVKTHRTYFATAYTPSCRRTPLRWGDKRPRNGRGHIIEASYHTEPVLYSIQWSCLRLTTPTYKWSLWTEHQLHFYFVETCPNLLCSCLCHQRPGYVLRFFDRIFYGQPRHPGRCECFQPQFNRLYCNGRPADPLCLGGLDTAGKRLLLCGRYPASRCYQ